MLTQQHLSTDEYAMRADDFVVIEAIGDLGRDQLWRGSEGKCSCEQPAWDLSPRAQNPRKSQGLSIRFGLTRLNNKLFVYICDRTENYIYIYYSYITCQVYFSIICLHLRLRLTAQNKEAGWMMLMVKGSCQLIAVQNLGVLRESVWVRIWADPHRLSQGSNCQPKQS